MRISDWSSDVCSSDLDEMALKLTTARWYTPSSRRIQRPASDSAAAGGRRPARFRTDAGRPVPDSRGIVRSEERRVGKAGVSTCRSRWSPEHKNKKVTTQQHSTDLHHLTDRQNN